MEREDQEEAKQHVLADEDTDFETGLGLAEMNHEDLDAAIARIGSHHGAGGGAGDTGGGVAMTVNPLAEEEEDLEESEMARIAREAEAASHEAATRIQAVHRGNAVRKEARERNGAATKIQAAQRGRAVRNTFYADEWFYVGRERESVPVTFAALAKLYKSQDGVHQDTLVFGGGMEEWTKASEVRELQQFAPSAFALRAPRKKKSKGTTFAQRLQQSRLDQKSFIRRCLGELENGAHESTLQHIELVKKSHSMISVLTPRLNATGLAYDTLRLNPLTNRLKLNEVPVFRLVLESARDVPGPGARKPVMLRCCRLALYDGVRFVSNFRREVCSNAQPDENAPYMFHSKSAVVVKGGDLTPAPGSATMSSEGKLQIYVELNLIYNLTDEVPQLQGFSQAKLGRYMRDVGFTQEELDAAGNLEKVVNEITTAWCLIPFPTCTPLGNLKGAKTLHVPLYGGTINNPVAFKGTKGGALPGNAKAGVSEATFMGSLLGSNSDGVPRLVVRLDKLNVNGTTLDKRNGPIELSEFDAARALPKHFLCSMQALPYVAMYRFALADALLGSNPPNLIGLGVPNLQPRWDPLLKMFPAVLDDPMLFFAFTQRFEKLTKAEKGDTFEAIKAAMEVQLFRVWPLRQSLSLPPKGSDLLADYQSKRFALIRTYLQEQSTNDGFKRTLGTSEGFRHKPFNVADMTYSYATQGQFAWNFVK